MANALQDEPSGYLRLHAEQAIAWRPWKEDAFAEAVAADKPVLVSIGYLACHWCHVMAQESFSDPAIAEAINRDFVAVKIDREERPDVDRSILDAMARIGARTGWPVTAFMTPQGEVFAGGSYYPPAPRYGLPGFPDVLAEALRVYHQKGWMSAPPMPDRARPTRSGSDSAIFDVDRYATFLTGRLFENIDALYGGFGLSGPRFANAAAHQLLWRRHVVSGTGGFGDAVVGSLQAICRSALVDHVGGGVHRYCSDDAWTVPHFEKMLYDNAQLLELLTWVWRGTRDTRLKDCAEGIASWAVAEMMVPGSGFASSLSADDEDSGTEGGFYRWNQHQIAEALGGDAPFFLAHYEVGSFEGDPAGPLVPIECGCRGEVDEPRLAGCRARLREARSLRPTPVRDRKVMADWNGLMLVALVEAGSVFARRDWLAVAIQIFDALVERLSCGDRLHHCVTEGVIGPDGFLDDYVMMSRAALRLFEAFGKPRYLDFARTWVATLDAEFWDAANGGYCMSSAAQWRPMARLRTITETSLPSGNGLMIGVLARLYDLTGAPAYRDRAERLVEAFHTDITKSGIAGVTSVGNVQTLAHFVKIKVSGDPANQQTRTLMRIALDHSLPDRLVLGPGAGDGEKDRAQPAAQICVGTSCLAPVTSVEELRRLLSPGGLSEFLT